MSSPSRKALILSRDRSAEVLRERAQDLFRDRGYSLAAEPHRDRKRRQRSVPASPPTRFFSDSSGWGRRGDLGAESSAVENISAIAPAIKHSLDRVDSNLRAQWHLCPLAPPDMGAPGRPAARTTPRAVNPITWDPQA